MDSSQKDKQLAYRSMPSKLKKKHIEQATQLPENIRANPQAGQRYPEENFIDLRVGHKKDIRLATYRYTISQHPVGVVLIFNGLYYHANHNAHVAKELADNGYVVVGFDYRGYGKSQGEKGEVQSFESFLDDCLVFIQAIESIYSDLPKFAIGASLGGLLVYHISLRNPDRFTGVILVSAMIKPMVGSLLCTIAATISKLLPKVKCLAPIRGVATKNKNVSDDLEKDPDYYTGEVPANTYKLLLNALNDCSKTFANYTGNVLIIQGGIDKVVSPDGAFELLDKCQSKDKTLYFYESMWHDAFHEQEVYDIMPKIIEWLRKRTPHT